MLGKFIASLFSRRAEMDLLPVVQQERIKAAHSGAPLERHSEILFGDLRVAGVPVRELVQGSLASSDAQVPPLKALHRPLATYFLARYFLHALRIDGALAECGVFRGTSALALCRAAKAADRRFDGARLHLVDSFEGLSAASPSDSFLVPGRRGVQSATAPGNLFEPSYDAAVQALREFPGVRFHRGWIPAVLAELPEQRWSFVHVDVDLYEPTYGTLEYFYPRLAPGGVIVCDDYGSVWFPGAARAWNRFCDEQQLAFVVLDTGQSVLMKGR